MVLGESLEKVISLVGHDGSQVLWDKLPEPLKRRAFTFEEMQYVALNCGSHLATYRHRMLHVPVAGVYPQRMYTFPIQEVLAKFDGILTGHYHDSKNAHAVAWDAKGKVIYDPSGPLRSIDSFLIEGFHAKVS